MRSNHRAAGVRVGERKSIRRGQSQEFADHRPYVPGDDLRFLDWHLYGRLDTLWVKLFEEESDRTIQLLLDCSASMHGEKIEYAKQVAGALSFVALGQSDRVVIAGLNEAMSHYSPARRGRKATKPLFDTLVSMNANGQTDIPRAFLMRCRDNAVHPFGCSLRIFCLKTASNLRFENFVVVGENCTCFTCFLHPNFIRLCGETCYWWTKKQGRRWRFLQTLNGFNSTRKVSCVGPMTSKRNAEKRGLDTLDSSPLFPWKSW